MEEKKWEKMFAKKSGGIGRVTGASKTFKTKKKLSETSTFKCPICLDPIKEASKDTTDEDAIVYEGRCNRFSFHFILQNSASITGNVEELNQGKQDNCSEAQPTSSIGSID